MGIFYFTNFGGIKDTSHVFINYIFRRTKLGKAKNRK